MSNDLNNAIDAVAVETDTTKTEIIRKALTLYLAARRGAKQGQIVGLANPETKQLETEFIGP
jgi:predicted transcriptional regulator